MIPLDTLMTDDFRVRIFEDMHNNLFSKYLDSVPTRPDRKDMVYVYERNGFGFQVHLISSVSNNFGYVDVRIFYPGFIIIRHRSHYPPDDKELEYFLQAVNNPKLWPLCIEISWARPFAERFLTNFNGSR
jgi:hypothetical protein